MPTARNVLTPDALEMLEIIARTGSFAAAARAIHMVPSALTYRVRQIEDALDVLLFDRSSRQARLTDAGKELLREGARLLADVDAVANRIKRVATGWEPQFTIAMDSIIVRSTMMELCESFFALKPPTSLKLRSETLSGTLEVLASGQADLAIGVVVQAGCYSDLQREPLGSVHFVFAVSSNHPLAHAIEPLTDADLRPYRAVALADSIKRGGGLTISLLPGQDVMTVPDMPAKLDAQLRGLGVGFLPTCLAQPYIDTERLVVKKTEQSERRLQYCYVWRKSGKGGEGRALRWWLDQLQNPVTRAALLEEKRY
ncbi:LysR substrate-binding domain-containing protein [Undibacterium sp. Ren11W]|uniref:LysR substrate-binding domain-containing protein n=1 Tax=Undibacterium sp. Ren11W TaxID=3413045 RepID=UPI003BF19A50